MVPFHHLLVYRVLPSFTEFQKALPSFTWFYWTLVVFYRVLIGFT